jgi:unsaturated chondroitin disaccharide hydrolase
MNLDHPINLADLSKPLDRVFDLAAQKVQAIAASWDVSRGTPVFTVAGKYQSRGWTEWTQGFQYGCALLTFDATDDRALLELGRKNTIAFMAPHVSHVGVHDHGFNNLSTYGNLRRLMREGRIPANDGELAFYELAIKTSGAVQASRWSDAIDGGGYVYSFNGPHSLFIDTMRTIRILGVAHQLGHVLMGENDRRISLLGRLITHGLTTAKYNIYYGQGRDAYDLPHLNGRTVHEAIFNTKDGQFRCPSSQQGYSPFTIWTRGLAWAVLGFAEELEFLATLDEAQFTAAGAGSKADVISTFTKAARATADFYIDQATASDGIPYWDTGAPNLHKLEGWQKRPADPFNEHEPVDSSAAAIAAQGLVRLGKFLGDNGKRYTTAGLATTATLLTDAYLSTDPSHQGLLLHSVYHRPNGWDYIPPGRKVPCGESSMWGDYHLLELALLLGRMSEGLTYLTFFS